MLAPHDKGSSSQTSRRTQLVTDAEKIRTYERILKQVQRECAPIVRDEAHMTHEELLRAEGYEEAINDVRKALV